MGMDKIVKSTTNYDMFRRLERNRSIPESRVKKIMNSIIGVGYITSPIIVNELFEVIDGQGRLKALQRLSLPVEYLVHEGAGINECRAMNLHQTNWTIQDYIDSYAEESIEAYVLLNDRIKKYKALGLQVVMNAISGLDGLDSNKLKEGKFDLDNKDGRYDYADILLDYEMRFIQISTCIVGNKKAFFMAIGYAMKNFEGDKSKEDRLFDALNKLSNKIMPISTKLDALDEISRIYNMTVKGQNKIYLKTDYEKEMDMSYPWYTAKYLIARRKKEQVMARRNERSDT